MRIAALILLAGAIHSAMAEWIPIDEIDTNITITYVDPSAGIKQGDKVKMKSLIDFSTFQFFQFDVRPKPYLSISHHYEYDCKAKRQRRLSSTFHSGNMAKGEVISRADRIGNWESVRPSSVDETLWQRGCGKAK